MLYMLELLNPKRILVWLIVSVVVLILVWGLYAYNKLTAVQSGGISVFPIMVFALYSYMVMENYRDNVYDGDFETPWENFFQALNSSLMVNIPDKMF